jgi:hypothetical protein
MVARNVRSASPGRAVTHGTVVCGANGYSVVVHGQRPWDVTPELRLCALACARMTDEDYPASVIVYARSVKNQAAGEEHPRAKDKLSRSYSQQTLPVRTISVLRQSQVVP